MTPATYLRERSREGVSKEARLLFLGGSEQAVGVCRGETPRTPPAAGEVAHVLMCSVALVPERLGSGERHPFLQPPLAQART
jgi:hypothetical protein